MDVLCKNNLSREHCCSYLIDHIWFNLNKSGVDISVPTFLKAKTTKLKLILFVPDQNICENLTPIEVGSSIQPKDGKVLEEKFTF